MNLPRLAVKRAVTFSMVYAALTGFGIMGLALLPVELFPDITFPMAVVFVDYEGSSPEDIESLVTRPIEEAVSSVSGIKNITSDSRQGVAFILLEFAWGTNMEIAKEDIRENLKMYEDFFPQEMRSPLIVAFDPSMMPISFLGVSGDLPTHELRAIAKERIEPMLERVPGVALAIVTGGQDRQIQVRLDPTRMRARRIAAAQVINAIRMENMQMPAGTFDQGQITYAVHTQGKYTDVNQIARTIVGYAGTSPVRVQDVANVVDTFAEELAGTHINGAPGVMMVVMKQSDANTVKVGEEVLKEIPNINTLLPPGVELSTIFEQSGFIQRSLGNLANTAVLGFIMAGIVLLFFLRNLRASVIVAMSIPLSLLMAFFVMYLLDLNLNIISLAGLALAIGMLVDNAIVVLENTVRFMEDGNTPMEAAVKGPSEILTAITASTLTTVSVFVPILFVPGIAGVMFKDMAITICVSLAASLFVATSLVPLMGSRLLRPASAKKSEYRGLIRRLIEPFEPLIQRLSGFIGRFLERAENTYSRHLGWTLDHRRITVLAAFILFIGSMGLMAVIDQEWLPESQEEQIIINVEREPGISIQEMEATMSRLERIAMRSIPEAYAVTSSYGPGEGFASFSSTASNQGSIEINLVGIGERERDTVEIRDALMPLLEQEPGVEMTAQLGGGMNMMTEGDIIVEIFGHDLETAQGIALDLIDQIRELKWIVHVSSSYEKGRPELEVKLNREQISAMGLSGSAVTSTLSTYMRGTIATWYTEGSREHEVLVRADEPYRDSASAIQDLLVATPMGNQIPMADLITLEPSRAPVTISRKNQQRVVYVNIDVLGAKLGVVTRNVQDLLEQYEMPEGFQWAVGGAADDMMESFIWLFVALVAGSLLVYMVMASQFESMLNPFIIIFTIPLSFIGVTWALFLSGTALSVVAMIGIIILVGIVVNNAIVMIDYIEQLRERGIEMFEAVRIAARRRMRPILMTALTTILAMLPLALEMGTGAELWAPMARSVIGGLTAATFLTLLIIPVVYTLFGELRLRFSKRRIERGKVVGREYVRIKEMIEQERLAGHPIGPDDPSAPIIS